jgi:hypothetical protein
MLRELAALLLPVVANLTGRSKYKITQVGDMAAAGNDPGLQEELKNFEADFDYPLDGNKRFRIIHGRGGNYFNFVTSMGAPVFYIARHRAWGWRWLQWRAESVYSPQWS